MHSYGQRNPTPMFPHVWHLVRTPQTQLPPKKFSVFLCRCVCIRLLSSADCNPSEPCLYVCACLCLSIFFLPSLEIAGLHVCACLWVFMRDVQRNALWYRESYRNAISLSVPACIHVGFIRIWKCCAAVPGAVLFLRPLPLSPFSRSSASVVSLAGSCIRDEGLHRRGRPTPGETIGNTP